MIKAAILTALLALSLSARAVAADAAKPVCSPAMLPDLSLRALKSGKASVLGGGGVPESKISPWEYLLGSALPAKTLNFVWNGEYYIVNVLVQPDKSPEGLSPTGFVLLRMRITKAYKARQFFHMTVGGQLIREANVMDNYDPNGRTTGTGRELLEANHPVAIKGFGNAMKILCAIWTSQTPALEEKKPEQAK